VVENVLVLPNRKCRRIQCGMRGRVCRRRLHRHKERCRGQAKHCT
jgi:hypothetical protein